MSKSTTVTQSHHQLVNAHESIDKSAFTIGTYIVVDGFVFDGHEGFENECQEET